MFYVSGSKQQSLSGYPLYISSSSNSVMIAHSTGDEVHAMQGYAVANPR
jgi:hypothetical protein